MSPASEPEDVGEHLQRPASELDAADAAVAVDDARGPDLPNLPLIDASPEHPGDVKPTWRGWIHAATFPITIIAGIVLIALAVFLPAMIRGEKLLPDHDGGGEGQWIGGPRQGVAELPAPDGENSRAGGASGSW